jgi:hypothetical protein
MMAVVAPIAVGKVFVVGRPWAVMLAGATGDVV